MDCNGTGQADSKGRQLSTFGEQTYLGFEEARQYLYKLAPKVEGGNMASRTATSVGRLDIVWRTAMGEVGHMETVQLPRKVGERTQGRHRCSAVQPRLSATLTPVLCCQPPSFDEAHLELRSMPSRVTFGEPFTAQCKVGVWVCRGLVVWLWLGMHMLTGGCGSFTSLQLVNLSTQPVVWQLGFDESQVRRARRGWFFFFFFLFLVGPVSYFLLLSHACSRVTLGERRSFERAVRCGALTLEAAGRNGTRGGGTRRGTGPALEAFLCGRISYRHPLCLSFLA